VIIDDVVESRSECTTGLVGGCVVVVFGWISQTGVQTRQQHHPMTQKTHRSTIMAPPPGSRPNQAMKSTLITGVAITSAQD